MTSRAILILLATVATTAAVSIATPDASAQSLRRGACASDIQSLCGKPARGELRACLAQNRTKLSDACKIAIADRWLERTGRRGGRKSGGGAEPNAD